MLGPQTATTRIAVVGLWHLGAVIAAVLADLGFDVVGLDSDDNLLEGLRDARPAVGEPGLAALIQSGQASGKLRFAAIDDAVAVEQADVVWIAHDTPVGEDDVAEPQIVLDEAELVLAKASAHALVVISSQLPVGSVARLERRMHERGRDDLAFACMPENLRLGQAIATFRDPERFVVGVRDDAGRARIDSLLAPFARPIEWMRVESAEMTKHALNAFLATSVAFINEIASICERVGADAAEVSRGLRGDQRIGPRAYLSPGEAFAGGTLARDLRFLADIAAEKELESRLLDGVMTSNVAHREWPRRALRSVLGGLAGRRVAIWGLTYKPGTDTLRRSPAVALCEWLNEQAATIQAHDPAVSEVSLPGVELCQTPLAAASGADALVVCTPWSEYRDIDAVALAEVMNTPVVLDGGGFLAATLGSCAEIRYTRVGAPQP